MIAFPGPHPESEARALLNFVLQHGDIVGTDHAGRTVLQLAVDPWTLDRLAAFDAGSEELEDADAEPEPDQEMGSAPIMLDEVRAKRAGLAIRCLQALVLAFLLAVPHLDAHAGQAPAMTRPAKHRPTEVATPRDRIPSGTADATSVQTTRCSDSGIVTAGPRAADGIRGRLLH